MFTPITNLIVDGTKFRVMLLPTPAGAKTCTDVGVLELVPAVPEGELAIVKAAMAATTTTTARAPTSSVLEIPLDSEWTNVASDCIEISRGAVYMEIFQIQDTFNSESLQNLFTKAIARGADFRCR